ncbi:hypothetical protein BD324DRAFT_421166 [Kockovaella imperatae]|uniref:RlpA-like double-psi beta-barrel-protein domain-containing protein-containing protein n=1 Tax=Kockovaella imperatae TaxID=4999 RepID=A0A1Y1UJ59_9TREE|nr:hypothetical protein BD324DRAFT_421166 [Kockovaella imperatae]ORX38081.1 hypothetical protein BD324DRAFT_421166 [Kockovaella imperatae]
MPARLSITLPLLVLSRGTLAVLFEKQGTSATVYYDLTNSFCTSEDSITGGGQWALGPNNQPTKCAPNAGYRSPAQIGSNSIVAFNQDLVWANRAKWCGKQVQIFDASGKEIHGPDGPFYIWDSCENCAKDDHIDLSAEAWSALGGECTVNNPSGISYKVLDTNIKQWRPDSPAGDNPDPVSSVGLSSASIQIVASAPVSSSAVQAAVGSSCTYGRYQCVGATLQQCNNVGQPARLDWQTIVPACANYCDVTRTPVCG